MDFNILLPVYNEELRLKDGISKSIEFLRKNFKAKFYLTIINNNSTDKTEDIALSLLKLYPELRYIHINQKGLGVAFREGVSCNQAEIVGYMDIDLATDLRHLLDVENLFKVTDVEFINGSRFNPRSRVSGRKWYRNISSYGLLFLLKTILGMKATDAICGFKFFKKSIAEELISASDRTENGWFFIIEMLLRAERSGVKIYELPVRWHDDGNSKVRIVETIANYIKNISRLKQSLN